MHGEVTKFKRKASKSAERSCGLWIADDDKWHGDAVLQWQMEADQRVDNAMIFEWGQ
jgi:hypothetical protein